jgi:hypothetical protein
MVRGPGQSVTRNRGFAGKPATNGHAHEIGAPIDLGITLSICGTHASSRLEMRGKGVAHSAASAAPIGIDEWPTEH